VGRRGQSSPTAVSTNVSPTQVSSRSAHQSGITTSIPPNAATVAHVVMPSASFSAAPRPPFQARRRRRQQPAAASVCVRGVWARAVSCRCGSSTSRKPTAQEERPRVYASKGTKRRAQRRRSRMGHASSGEQNASPVRRVRTVQEMPHSGHEPRSQQWHSRQQRRRSSAFASSERTTSSRPRPTSFFSSSFPRACVQCVGVRRSGAQRSGAGQEGVLPSAAACAAAFLFQKVGSV